MRLCEFETSSSKGTCGKEPVGNAAKLREAVKAAIDKLMLWNYTDRDTAKMALGIMSRLDAALDEPPRNCDVIGNTGRALVVHGFPTKSNQWGEGEWLEFVDWLFAPATKKEGEEK